ncbi:MAG: DUF45 domain-containing protein [Oscillospiraceae bacterium]|nr:DUF45 domain-containing protein [Oscillospiraceae bacterium]
MQHSIDLGSQTLFYTLTRKRVKNINLRIKPGGEILVSAAKLTPLAYIEAFLRQKEGWILRVLDEQKQSAPVVLPEGQGYLCGEMISIPEGESREQWQKRHAAQLLPAAYEAAWELFWNDGFPKPVLRLRKMKSRWGSCIPSKGVITLNTALVGASVDCQIAVAAHELCHMLYPDHSKAFYACLYEHFPNYESCRQLLKSAQSFLFYL